MTFIKTIQRYGAALNVTNYLGTSHGGAPFAFYPPQGSKRVRSIIVYSYIYIEGLKVEWDMPDGTIIQSRRVGQVAAATERRC